jgi:hypothetical protein
MSADVETLAPRTASARAASIAQSCERLRTSTERGRRDAQPSLSARIRRQKLTAMARRQSGTPLPWPSLKRLYHARAPSSRLKRSPIASGFPTVKLPVKPTVFSFHENAYNQLITLLERAKGIEPSYAAWEAAVLPLNYARFSVLSLFCLFFHTNGKVTAGCDRVQIAGLWQKPRGNDIHARGSPYYRSETAIEKRYGLDFSAPASLA